MGGWPGKHPCIHSRYDLGEGGRVQGGEFTYCTLKPCQGKLMSKWRGGNRRVLRVHVSAARSTRYEKEKKLLLLMLSAYRKLQGGSGQRTGKTGGLGK